MSEMMENVKSAMQTFGLTIDEAGKAFGRLGEGIREAMTKHPIRKEDWRK
jgi:hypothetical protein